MSFDISRLTFDPRNDYAAVVMEQGRVQTDADWNEWLAEYARRLQAETLDLLGHAAYPATTPDAFRIIASGPNTVAIGAGRMYVDGLLAENHGVAGDATWDPALAEMSCAPQPPPATPNTVDYTEQPYYPQAPPISPADGPFLAYLDLWTRPVNALQDARLIDAGIGLETSGRLQTVWQVKMMPADGATCATPDSQIPYPAPSAGLLTTNVVPNTASGPCCIATNTGYTGPENQCYLVEIQNQGIASDTAGTTGATFKWSRENGSVQTGVTSIANGTNTLGDPATVLAVESLGRDQVLGFKPGDWVEITDEVHVLGGVSGELNQIDQIDVASRTITLTGQSSFPIGTPDAALCTRIVRWDQSGKVYESDLSTVWWDLDAVPAGSTPGAIPVPLSDTTLVLENGVTVTFGTSSGGGGFNAGDYWSFAARTDGSIDLLTDAPPLGPHHHYAKLSIVDFSSSSASDCRTKFPTPSGEAACGCCTCTVGVEGSGADFTSIQKAVDSVPVTGGEVCILPGRYFERVVVHNRKDLVIRGCGAGTRIASTAFHKDPREQESSKKTPAQSGFAAVITITDSEHVTLTSFCVEAGDDEAGILLDRSSGEELFGFSDVDVTIEDLTVTASTLPAILARSAELLTIDDNRIAMKDVWSDWPAVYVSGREIHVDRNWIGPISAASEKMWLPSSVAGDLGVKEESRVFATVVEKRGPGGIQIAGPSVDVYVIENEIEFAARNGITLGSIDVVDGNGDVTGRVTGVVFTEQGECTKTRTLQIPIGQAPHGGSYVAGGRLADIHIERNRIRDVGLCGIGPVAFFDLEKTAEAIGVINLTIRGNEIDRSVTLPLDPYASKRAAFLYAAICVPDVENLVIEDNAVTDFGEQPGAPQVCGIFALNAETSIVSRNEILETRDWSFGHWPDAEGDDSSRGGIVVLLALPPSAGSAYAMQLSAPALVQGVPALRVEHNVVRVALGNALEAFGLGPFAIANNHLSTGGGVVIRERVAAAAVTIMNLGISLELTSMAGGYKTLYGSTELPQQGPTDLARSNGTVLFTGNVCQLVAQRDRERGFASVAIVSLDDVLFANNVCWLDGAQLTAFLDAFLLAVSIQVVGNRFQESVDSVLASGLTVGKLNLTSQNLSTYCLFALPQMLPGALNVSWVPDQLCEELQKRL